ncbi:hypothetical protein ANN_19940 [Periplaneta americana]|uniref:Mos1 transposase HTH domain-containing protein n=1 Tax=Periplaneta americana TaxID=6978 RepID=A0ABQ8SBI3_PERAM|nr:hypothetical protein ANN_19940 [Periplaneta americana]
MIKVIEHPSDCEMRSVIRFLNARNIKPADIHHQLCEVYGDDAISDGMIRRWVRKFNEGRVSVHDEQHIGQPSLINDDLVRAVDEKIDEDRSTEVTKIRAAVIACDRQPMKQGDGGKVVGMKTTTSGGSCTNILINPAGTVSHAVATRFLTQTARPTGLPGAADESAPVETGLQIVTVDLLSLRITTVLLLQ